jgi:hypothetical protein
MEAQPMGLTAADETLTSLALEWRLLLLGLSADGSLVAAAQEALMLSGESPALKFLVTQWSAGDFKDLPPIVLLSRAEMNGALGAYAISTGAIYLNADWLVGASKAEVNEVLTEELGHHLDGLLNAVDTPGDEGEYFSRLLVGKAAADPEKAALRNQSDAAVVSVGGADISAEQAAAPVIQANSLYTLVNAPSWTQGSTNAKAAGGDLVTINNSSENDFLVSQFSGITDTSDIAGQFAYIGLNDIAQENQWRVADGSLAIWFNWAAGEPNNANGLTEEDAVAIRLNSANDSIYGVWHDVPVSHKETSKGIAEIPISSSITLPATIKEGAGIITTTINLSAGTANTGNLANGATVYWKITGITADDLTSGTVSGTGIITKGQLQIQHAFKQDPDVGEQFQVSIFSDELLTQQIGTRSSAWIAENIVMRGNSVYQLVNGPTWTQAQANSRSLGGDLATINDAAENAWVHSAYGITYTGSNNYYYIGLSDNTQEGNWQWISGDISTYRNWNPSAPDSAKGLVDEDYALLGWFPSTEWQDAADRTYFTPSGLPPAISDNQLLGIAELPISSSITFATVAREGQTFTTIINLSAGGLNRTDPVEGAPIYWKISGITADDLTSGALSGTGLITNGQFQIQHILKQDPDIGEQIEVSIFSDAEMTQQIGTTKSAEIQDSSGPQGAINTGSAVFYITGVPAAGQTLTAVATSKDPDGDGTFSYQWEASADSSSTWTPIQGASTSTYTAAAGDIGKRLRSVISYRDQKDFAETTTTAPVSIISLSGNTPTTIINDSIKIASSFSGNTSAQALAGSLKLEDSSTKKPLPVSGDSAVKTLSQLTSSKALSDSARQLLDRYIIKDPSSGSTRKASANDAGFIDFTLKVGSLKSLTAQIALASEVRATGYVKINPNTGEAYDFTYDPATGLGAELLDTNKNGLVDNLRIHLQDGGLGDVDDSRNGEIRDPGALAEAPRLPVYRFYRNGVHFYTTNESERDSVISNSYGKSVSFTDLSINPQAKDPITGGWGYRYEGVAYQALDTQGKALYRFFSPSKGYHFVTTNANEALAVIQNSVGSSYNLSNAKGQKLLDNGWGFQYEETSYKVSTIAQTGMDTPVYRFFNQRKGVHFYSSSMAEAKSVVANSLGAPYATDSWITSTADAIRRNSLFASPTLLESGWGYQFEGVGWYV